MSGKAAGEDGWGETESEMSKAGEVDSSLSERPEHHRPRRLADWINPTGARKVHSLIDKVYKRKNLEIAWERVKANQGAGGIDGESIEAFGEGLEERLARLHEELSTDKYIPQPVRQQRIPKAGKPGEWRVLGIPTIYDRVCQQALLNRLEPIFEPIFDDANFGYRRGRSTKDALRKVWKEIEAGGEWIVDADLKDFFGSVVHEKLLTLVAQRVSDGRVLRLIEAMLTAGSYGEGHLFPTERGTPQGGVASPLLSNILLTPFDREMRRKGYQLTRYADDWVVTCVSAAEARAALEAASRILKELGVTINPQKTRIGARRRRRSRRRPVWTTCCLPCRGRMSRRPCGACPSGNGRVLIDATNPFTETSLKLVLADLGGTGATSASSGSPQSLSTSPRSMPRPQRALDVVSDPVPKAPAPSTTVMFTEASNTRRCWGWR